VAISFEQSKKYFPAHKCWVSGLPVRAEIGQAVPDEARARLGLDPKRFTFLVFGGSLGARQLNQTLLEVWPRLPEPDRWQVYHVTGTKEFDHVRGAYQRLTVRSQVVPYCHAMADAYGAADFVVCRAGASTVAELLAAGRRALLVPYPFASDNHQLYNAELLAKRGQGEVLEEASMTPVRLQAALERAMTAPAPPAPWMGSRDAAKRLADAIRRASASRSKQL
jgi:UDP-N-acetylglucosamine--N-acetylmuramyl-(pentapeptide) pyrophosphoryl-undecaprenol N-acetylglucosamine transferase